MTFALTIRIKHIPTFTYTPLDDNISPIDLKSNFTKFYEKEKKSFSFTGNNLIGIDDIPTSMEPIFLHIHLDSNFEPRNKITCVNLHKLNPKDDNDNQFSARLPTSLPLLTLRGSIKDKNFLPLDSKICFQCKNRTITQFGAFGSEDAGSCAISLYELIQDWLLMNQNPNETTAKNIITTRHELFSKGGGFFQSKGFLFIEIHNIQIDKTINILSTLGRSQETTPLATEETCNNLIRRYVQMHDYERNFFTPIARGTTGIESPLLYANIFVSENSLSFLPLPAYMIFDKINYDGDFATNLFYIMIDREESIGNHVKDEIKVTEFTNGNYKHLLFSQKIIAFFAFYLTLKTSKEPVYDFKERLHIRSSFMAKFICLYIQSINYNPDKQMVDGATEANLKTLVEQFSNPFLYHTLDCEDGTKGIQILYKSLVENKPQIKILKEMILKSDWKETLKISGNVLKEIMPISIKILFDLMKYITDNSETEDFSLIYDQTTNFFMEIRKEIDNAPMGENSKFIISSICRVLISTILQDFHYIACYYIDVFHLFGVTIGNSNDDLSEHVKNDLKKNTDTYTTGYIPKINFDTYKLKFTDVYKTIKDAHAAAILWPRTTFKNAITNFYSGSILAENEPYESFTKKHIVGKPTFGLFNENDLPMLLCEGTGMLEPGSFRDPLWNLRKTLQTFPFFKNAKKKMAFAYDESHIYQSISLALTPRFLKEFGTCSFMVSTNIYQKSQHNEEIMFQKAAKTYLEEKKKAIERLDANDFYFGKNKNEILEQIETKDALLRNYYPVLKTTPQEFDQALIGNGTSIINAINQISKQNKNRSLDNQMVLTRGLPYSYVMMKNENVMLVPFGFSGLQIISQHEYILKNKVKFNEFSNFEVEILSSVMNQRPYLPCLKNWMPVKNDIFELSSSQDMGKVFFIDEQVNQISLNKNIEGPVTVFIRQVNKKKDLASMFIIPIEIPVQNSKYEYLTIFSSAFHGSHRKSNSTKISFFFAPEQIPDLTTAKKIISDLKIHFIENFILYCEVVVEHLSTELVKLRMDLFVDATLVE